MWKSELSYAIYDLPWCSAKRVFWTLLTQLPGGPVSPILGRRKMRREKFKATLNPKVYVNSSSSLFWHSLSCSQFIVIPTQQDSLTPPSSDTRSNLQSAHHHPPPLVLHWGKEEAKKSCSVFPKVSSIPLPNSWLLPYVGFRKSGQMTCLFFFFPFIFSLLYVSKNSLIPFLHFTLRASFSSY